MDYYAEIEKRKKVSLGKIGELAFERYQHCKAVEQSEERIYLIDTEIARLERAVFEADQAQRLFSSYLAIKEGAVTLDQIKNAVQSGENLVTPPGAVKERSNENVT
ncbi:MAG: hypothetical protein A2Y91_03460 [Chloroflexi bacterium RBG_13_54_8]|nr:MAG: hypothetical protein A2Y91_03460 [Chloroflexi bacterium RBG_13_54_8]